MPSSISNNIGSSQLKSSLWLLLVLILTALVYWPFFQNGFLTTWDDNRYILDNPYIQNLNFEKALGFFSIYFDGHYHPLTLLSLSLDFQIDGFNPKVYHATNLLLHLINTLLVFWFVHLLLKKEQRNVALVTALLFGIAPMQVETVAWATERKNVLYAFFYLLSLVVWMQYLMKQRWIYYLLALVFFVMALLSKSMALPLVFTLVAIDYLYKRKWDGKKAIFEKIPFLTLAIIFGLVAVFAQKSTWGESLSQEHFSFGQRIFYAAYAYVAYGFKLLIPLSLSGFYPYPKLDGSFFFLSIAALVSFICLVFLFFRKFKNGGIARFGFIFFTINIFLLLKLFEVPAGDYIMADRYNYIASIGLLLLVVFYGNKIMQRNGWWKRGGIIFLVIYVVFISVLTIKQVTVWKSDETFYTNIIQQCPEAEVAYLNRGVIFQKKGQMKLAEKDYSQAIKLDSKNYKYYANRGIVYNETGRYNEAIADLSKAAKLSKNRTDIISVLGYAYMQIGQSEKAIQQFDMVIRVQPDNAEVLTNRGTVKYSSGNPEGAIQDYKLALNSDPNFINALYNLGLTHLNTGNSKAAVDDFIKTVGLDPNHSGAYSNMGVAWSRLGQYDKAFEAYNKAIEIEPGNFEAILNRGIDYFYQNDNEKALSDFEQCLQLNNSLAAAYYFKGLSLINLGRDGGCANLRIAHDKGFEMADKMLRNYCK